MLALLAWRGGLILPPRFPTLSFNSLRDTSANMVRQLAGEEVAALHLAHKHQSKDENLRRYTNPVRKPHFKALRRVERRLSAVFMAAVSSLGPSLQELHRQGQGREAPGASASGRAAQGDRRQARHLGRLGPPADTRLDQAASALLKDSSKLGTRTVRNSQFAAVLRVNKNRARRHNLGPFLEGLWGAPPARIGWDCCTDAPNFSERYETLNSHQWHSVRRPLGREGVEWSAERGPLLCESPDGVGERRYPGPR